MGVFFAIGATYRTCQDIQYLPNVIFLCFFLVNQSTVHIEGVIRGRVCGCGFGQESPEELMLLSFVWDKTASVDLKLTSSQFPPCTGHDFIPVVGFPTHGSKFESHFTNSFESWKPPKSVFLT